jgi:hypothetical protein
MVVTPCRHRLVWFLGLLLIVGVQLIFGMIQDGQALALSYESGPAHGQPYADAGRSADLMDDAQEWDDHMAGPDNGTSRPLSNPAGFRLLQFFMPGQLQFVPGPFRPPRLFY